MAILTIIATRDMRRVLAGCSQSVVTGATGSQHLRMVNRVRRFPDVRTVAVLANVSCLNMRLSLTSRLHAIVATHTIAGDTDVIKISRQPADRRVTVITAVIARNVRRMFAGRRYAVVAGAAGTQHLRVIHGIGRGEDARIVAILANTGCLYVRRAFANRVNTIVAARTVVQNADMIEIGRPPRDG